MTTTEEAGRIVAICGTASSSRAEILALPPEVEVWGLNHSYHWMPQFSRWFEMHDRQRYPHVYDEAHVAWLRDAPVPVIMQRHYDEFPLSVAFPDVTAGTLLRPLLTSSIAYMLAMAVHERVSKILLLGADMSLGAEYAYQRPACEYWIGVAEAQGIPVYIPSISPIGKGIRYGLDPATADLQSELMDKRDLIKAQIDQQREAFLAKLAEDLADLRDNYYGCVGAMDLVDKMMRQAEG